MVNLLYTEVKRVSRYKMKNILFNLVTILVKTERQQHRRGKTITLVKLVLALMEVNGDVMDVSYQR